MTESSLKLHSYYRSSCSWRVRIALRFKRLSYEYICVNLMERENSSEEYKSKNPSGRLPCLVVDGVYISQSMSIMEYLEEIYPENPLLPANPMERALARSIACTIVSDIHPMQSVMQLNIPQEQKPIWAHNVIDKGFEVIEAIIAKSAGEFCVGNSVTFADICLVPQVYNARMFKVDMSKFPTISRVFDSLMQLPEFIETAPDRMPEFSAAGQMVMERK